VTTEHVERERHEQRFAAMGTEGHVVVIDGTADDARWAVERIEQLEALWSRFRPDSEISRINTSPDVPVEVSRETYLLCERAVEAWLRTRGRFDATVLGAITSQGYDRTFTAVARELDEAVPEPEPTPGSDEIELDIVHRTVCVPAGVGIDPGGIGKGLAADLVVRELLGRGAAGACVNVGGDVRAAGDGPSSEGWPIGVADQYDTTRLVAAVPLADGALVTSTRLLRAWRRAGRDYHHLIDPVTGRPTDTDVDAVTVLAGEGWWAEALAKAVFVAGADDAEQILLSVGAAGVVFAGHDDIRYIGAMAKYRVEPAGIG
jgi:FAD:protein FMN transferase